MAIIRAAGRVETRNCIGVLTRVSTMWRQGETYPDPAVEVLDPRFLKYRTTTSAQRN
ncbi:hypothetical protein [Paraburkholderia kirstenboschensis]|uniref:Uncharacterized protein n=1 Tax=Paraburkholderia kirstenboschensis TaxID=1245436 RepID=A0ABZ0E8L6_9BURK|nr:hypothetical protein [Paraburkholderia kirstenboschensis]WOD13601.1 hypothetical protein RW095_06330 [Paraburkholderia kirstenboschensis]